MCNQKKSLLSVLKILLLIFLLEVVAFFENEIVAQTYGFPILAPVITIIIVPILAFVLGMKYGEFSKTGMNNKLLIEKNKLVKRIFKMLIIVFYLLVVYICMITIGRIITIIYGTDLIVFKDMNSYSGLFLELYNFTKTEVYVFVIILTATLGFFKTFTLESSQKEKSK